MKVTIDLDKLLEEGKITQTEYDKFSQFPARGTAALAFNILVGFGVIASYSRPGGNVTGLAVGSFSAIHVKRLDLLKAIAPRVKRVVWLQGDFHGLEAAQRAVRTKEIEAGTRLWA